MTRNPETTEAAKVESSQRIESLLAKHSIGAFCGTDTACSCDRKWRSNAAWRSHVADAIAAVLAVSPAVTEGERATELARRAGFAEGLRDAADEAGSWGPSAAHIAMQLRAKAERVEQFNNIARLPPAPSPAVTAAEDETRGREKPHTLTRYGTTNCPVEGVRANVDDGECSACGLPVVAAVPADPNEKD